MSHSPHRLRGDAAEAWRLLLFGEVLRALEDAGLQQVTVRANVSVKLPRSGRWQTGLAAMRPALDDDVLGHTALAVAWRWACAEFDANAWPSVGLVAKKAVDVPVVEAEQAPLAFSPQFVIDETSGDGRQWCLHLSEPSVLRVRGADSVDFSEVDRIADIASAWLQTRWSVVSGG